MWIFRTGSYKFLHGQTKAQGKWALFNSCELPFLVHWLQV